MSSVHGFYCQLETHLYAHCCIQLTSTVILLIFSTMHLNSSSSRYAHSTSETSGSLNTTNTLQTDVTARSSNTTWTLWTYEAGIAAWTRWADRSSEAYNMQP